MAGLQDAVDALRAERERIDGAIRALEGIANGGGGVRRMAGARRRRGRPPGRPRKVGRPAGRPGRKGTKAPRGLLQAKVHQILTKAGKPVAPTALRDAVIKAGYPSKNPQTLYTQIYALAKKDPKLRRSGDGFSLGARRGRPPKGRLGRPRKAKAAGRGKG